MMMAVPLTLTWSFVAAAAFIVALRYSLFVQFALILSVGGFGKPHFKRFRASMPSIVSGITSVLPLTLALADIWRKPAALSFLASALIYVLCTFGDVSGSSDPGI